MLVKDWLSVVSKALNIKVVDGNTWAQQRNQKKLVGKFMEIYKEINQ